MEIDQVEHLSGAPLEGRLLALPKNIRPGQKGLPWTNALAYLACSLVTKKKKFYNIDSRPDASRLAYFW